eukprot:1109948-Pyramimonas_sp.AAC.2
MGCVLNGEDRAFSSTTFESVRIRMDALLLEKLNYLNQLPWYICSLGHWDDRVFMECGRKVLEKFNVDPRQEMHHRLSWKLLAPGAEFRLELEAVLRGDKTRWEASDAFLLVGLFSTATTISRRG